MTPLGTRLSPKKKERRRKGGIYHELNSVRGEENQHNEEDKVGELSKEKNVQDVNPTKKLGTREAGSDKISIYTNHNANPNPKEIKNKKGRGSGPTV